MYGYLFNATLNKSLASFRIAQGQEVIIYSMEKPIAKTKTKEMVDLSISLTEPLSMSDFSKLLESLKKDITIINKTNQSHKITHKAKKAF